MAIVIKEVGEVGGGGGEWVFFFFKQKTAYEIYQCDWSSDVCSYDLEPPTPPRPCERVRNRSVLD